jgi:hypothetical protein
MVFIAGILASSVTERHASAWWMKPSYFPCVEKGIGGMMAIREILHLYLAGNFKSFFPFLYNAVAL